VSQLRPHVLQGSTAVTAAGGAAAAAGGLLTWGASSIRFFSSDDVKRIYVGNLSYEATAQDVQQAFEKFGKVHVSAVRADPVMRATCICRNRAVCMMSSMQL